MTVRCVQGRGYGSLLFANGFSDTETLRRLSRDDLRMLGLPPGHIRVLSSSLQSILPPEKSFLLETNKIAFRRKRKMTRATDGNITSKRKKGANAGCKKSEVSGQCVKERRLQTTPPSQPHNSVTGSQHQQLELSDVVEEAPALKPAASTQPAVQDALKDDAAASGAALQAQGTEEPICAVCFEGGTTPGLKYPCNCNTAYHHSCLQQLIHSDLKWRKECPTCRQSFVRLPLELRMLMNNLCAPSYREATKRPSSNSHDSSDECEEIAVSAPLRAGMNVFVRFDCSYWYKAQVTEVGPGTARVYYEDDGTYELIATPDPDVITEERYRSLYGQLEPARSAPDVLQDPAGIESHQEKLEPAAEEAPASDLSTVNHLERGHLTPGQQRSVLHQVSEVGFDLTPWKTGSLCGYKGVSCVGNRFKATIQMEGKRVRLGLYSTAEEAGVAYAKQYLAIHHCAPGR